MLSESCLTPLQGGRTRQEIRCYNGPNRDSLELEQSYRSDSRDYKLEES
jgi:hypothetical protein